MSDLTHDAIRIGVVYMHGNDWDLVKAIVAMIAKCGEPVTVRVH